MSVTARYITRGSILSLKRVGTSLKSAAEHGEETAYLDVGLATKEVARPHHEESADSTAGTEDAVGRRNGGRRDGGIAWLTFKREVEVRVPSRLTDRTTDDGGTVAIGLQYKGSAV